MSNTTHCPHCGKIVDEGDAHCRHCGGVLGAPTSSTLEALVEKKAREILAEERAAEKRAADEERRRNEAADAARRAADDEAAAERKTREAQLALEDARARREVVARTPRRFLAFHRSMLGIALLFAVVLGLPAGCLGECVSRRPMWGRTLCPGVCSDCRGPGVIQTWHTNTGNGSSDHMAAFCHNDRVNVDTKEFWFLAVSGKAEEIELSWWKRNGLTLAVVALFALLPLPFLAARFRRRSLDAESRDLARRISMLEATLDRSRSPGDTYR